MISFTCNICCTSNTVEEIPWEPSTCSGCGSNVRMRAIIHLLSMALFEEARALPDFPVNPNVKGIGLSDENCYALPLAKKFDYTNTFYDCDPYFDLTSMHIELYGTYDFILSGDVFEHIAPPIERAFEEAYSLLKPNGFLCITVPSSPVDQPTIERYPDLHEYSIVELGGGHILVNRKKDKSIEIHKNIEFHGGRGATLVMRDFSQGDLARKLRRAGFTSVDYLSESIERLGILPCPGNWSLPLLARKGRHSVMPERGSEPESETLSQQTPDLELESQIAWMRSERVAMEHRMDMLESKLRMVAESRWVKLGRRFGVGPKMD